MKLLGSITLAVALSGAACTNSTAPVTPITALPRDLTASENKIITASNDFAFDLFRVGNTDQHKANVFISPLSASMALGMTSNGANGATYEEMRAGLRLGAATRPEINEAYKSLITLLRGLDPGTDFRIANSIWYERSFPFHAAFLDESKLYYDARVEALDFKSSSAVSTVNSWVSEQTNTRIPAILDVIREDERMFLINAIYFKGTWQKQFDKAQTVDAPFHAADGTTAMVPMMAREKGVDYVSTPEYSAVDLPYGNSAFTMTVVMPHNTDIDIFAESFDQTKWAALVGSLQPNSIQVYLPRFRMEWKRKLNDDLMQLGMRLPFSPGSADFTRMSPAGLDLFITQVLQKTYVDVDEAGTEAAAATVVGIGVVSMPPSFRADRPFLVVIRERFSGTILFLGKVAKLPA
ncbi:MAG TPA: serpin family protein [Gemmatimonadaceae bacterium]|nr:serpin family protein [Gemmatimonadaceae bacterium]